jgi:hypothetical protein
MGIRAGDVQKPLQRGPGRRRHHWRDIAHIRPLHPLITWRTVANGRKRRSGRDGNA